MKAKQKIKEMKRALQLVVDYYTAKEGITEEHMYKTVCETLETVSETQEENNA